MLKQAINPTVVKELVRTINGYYGYEAQDSRTVTDKNFRRYMVTEARSLLKHVNTLEAKITDSQSLVPKIEKLKRGIVTVSEGLKYPTYHDASFFNMTSLNSERLSQLYSCESTMLHNTRTLISDIDTTLIKTDPGEIHDIIIQIQNYIDNFNLHQFERESLILD